MPSFSDLLKSHVRGFTRKDGTYVAEHDDKRQAAGAGGEGYSHPHVVGKAEITDPYEKHPGKADAMSFAGTSYSSTGKRGNSFHDETPVREFESGDGHRVWMDEHSRVHADGQGEVSSLRKKYEAHQSQKPGADRGLPGKGGKSANDGKGGAGGAPAAQKGAAAPDGQKKPAPAAKDPAKPKRKKPSPKVETWESLKQHPMHSESDLAYFKGKGYEPNDVKAIWDRDHAAGHKPVQHQDAPDVVGVAADPDHYRKGKGGNLAKALAGKSALLFGDVALMKSHVEGHALSDGAFVAAPADKRLAKK